MRRGRAAASRQHLTDLLALQVLLAAAQGAGDDGEVADLGPAGQGSLGHMASRADDEVVAPVALPWAACPFELAAEEHVQEERLQHVVAVVAQRDLGGAQLIGHAVEDALAQAAAGCTWSCLRGCAL